MKHSDSLPNDAGSEAVLLRRVIDHAPLGALLNDRQGRILYANDSASKLLGYGTDELKTMNMVDIDVKYSMAQVRVLVEGLREKGGEVFFQTRMRRRDGSEFSAEVMINVAGSGSGDFAFCFLRDVSHLQEQLEQKEQLGFLVENISEAVYIYDDHRNIVYANKFACGFTGYSREELLAMNISDLDPSYPVSPPDSFRRLAQQGRKMAFETEHRLKDGEWVPVEVSLSANILNGKIYNCAYVRDIRHRKAYLRELEDFRQALEHTSDAIYLYDGGGYIRYANWTACRELGYGKEELCGMHISQLDRSLEGVGREDGELQPALKATQPVQAWHRRKDGSSYPVEIAISASTFEGDDCVMAFARDISERVHSQQALAESEERFRLIADTSPVGLLISRVADQSILYANRQAAQLFGEAEESLLGATLSAVFGRAAVQQEVVERLAAAQELNNHEFMLAGSRESPLWVSLNTRRLELRGENVLCSVIQDVTEARELSNQLSYHATYDDLTGLVNRREFEDRLQEVIELAAREDSENALCYLDLDQFKVINDTCGHMAGDELLRQLAHVLYQSVRRDDTLARLGGDEFAILLEHCSLANAEQVAGKVRQAVQDFRFQWQGKTFNISVSVGLVPIANSGETISDVMRRADTACYAAKDAGRNRIHIYRFGDEELVHRHGEMQWVSRLTAALDSGRLELWKQPIRPLRAGGEAGEHFELLLRMRDEEGKLIMPGAFLPAAERYDLASRLDRWVIQEAFDWLLQHPGELQSLASCAINLSGRTLSDSQFLEQMTRYIAESKVPTEKICFEITETAAIANLSNASQFMRALKKLGCKFALDDFGSGLSSFAYLKNLPVDYVKIDGFFVKDVTSDPVDLAMVKAINDMTHAMGKQTIAEFVEDQEILAVLVELGVDYVQGYGIAHPEPLRAAATSAREADAVSLPRE